MENDNVREVQAIPDEGFNAVFVKLTFENGVFNCYLTVKEAATLSEELYKSVCQLVANTSKDAKDAINEVETLTNVREDDGKTEENSSGKATQA